MKPFDLIEALSGEPVITKSGKSVSELHYFKTIDPGYFTIICVVNGEYKHYRTNGINPHNGDDGILLMASEIEI